MLVSDLNTYSGNTPPKRPAYASPLNKSSMNKKTIPPIFISMAMGEKGGSFVEAKANQGGDLLQDWLRAPLKERGLRIPFQVLAYHKQAVFGKQHVLTIAQTYNGANNSGSGRRSCHLELRGEDLRNECPSGVMISLMNIQFTPMGVVKLEYNDQNRELTNSGVMPIHLGKVTLLLIRRRDYYGAPYQAGVTYNDGLTPLLELLDVEMGPKT
ncbi:hypothetical protein VNO77_27252 [Canavalia gladiata]|uniref:Uncharacterized protein n=1 Tax=Canavalia gladiata TaxID=3824 RepID=A0AAN9KV16_CANGL